MALVNHSTRTLSDLEAPVCIGSCFKRPIKERPNFRLSRLPIWQRKYLHNAVFQLPSLFAAMAEQKAANLLNLSSELSTTVEAPSQCLLRAHSLSPSSSWRRQRQRQSSRPRASTATARSAGNAPTGTTTINWWPTGGGSNGLMGMLQRGKFKGCLCMSLLFWL